MFIDEVKLDMKLPTHSVASLGEDWIGRMDMWRVQSNQENCYHEESVFKDFIWE